MADPITIYATVTDLGTHGLNEAALRRVDPESQADALEAASRVMDDFLGAQFTLPFLGTVPLSMTRACCVIAAYNIVSVRGFNPELGADAILQIRYDEIMKWLRDIRDGKMSLAVTDSSVPLPGGGSSASMARCISSSPRGFSSRGTPSDLNYDNRFNDAGGGKGFVGD